VKFVIAVGKQGSQKQKPCCQCLEPHSSAASSQRFFMGSGPSVRRTAPWRLAPILAVAELRAMIGSHQPSSCGPAFSSHHCPRRWGLSPDDLSLTTLRKCDRPSISPSSMAGLQRRYSALPAINGINTLLNHATDADDWKAKDNTGLSIDWGTICSTKCLRNIHRGQNGLPWIHFAERIILSLVDRHFMLGLSLLVGTNLDFGSKN
jgi:hypothetical protein